MEKNKQPKSQMGQELKTLLDNMSQEEFDEDWNKITALNLEGIRLDEYHKFLTEFQESQKNKKCDEFLETLYD